MAILSTRVLAALSMLATVPLFAVEIIAHRGASHDAPENTVAALKLGWEQKADADELDIWLSKDGRIVVFHDKDTKRIGGVDRLVAEQTFDELRALDAGAWKGAPWKGEKIPTLDEALATLPEGKQMFIEIKCGSEVLPELERVLRASGKPLTQLTIIGFGYETMKDAKARFPQMRVYWLVATEKESRGRVPTIEEMVAKAKAAGVDGLNLSYKFPIDAPFVARIREAGLKFYVWTVDDAQIARKIARLGVDGITTNRPAWLRAELKVRDASSPAR